MLTKISNILSFQSNQILNRIRMFNIIETSCPYNNWVITARKLCADPDRYHCLIDEFSRPGWICTDPIWVEAGKTVKLQKIDIVSKF